MDVELNQGGNLCTKREKIVDDFTSGSFLKQHGSYPNEPTMSEGEIMGLLEELIEDGQLIARENKKGETMVYKPNYYHIEKNIISGLAMMFHYPVPQFCRRADIDQFIVDYEKTYQPLADKQKDGIHMALENQLSILTGGPGTGKTHTTNAIVQAIETIKPRATITLLAPTGKAAKRLSEMTGKVAKTIHRGLGIKGFGSTEELTQLNSDFVIVDESSMIDAYLFDLLIQQSGSNTRLLFVGDYHQLPSVGPGLILRDLIQTGKIPVTELTEIFRQAQTSQIVLNAHKMQQGLTTASAGGLTFDPNKEDSYFVERKKP